MILSQFVLVFIAVVSSSSSHHSLSEAFSSGGIGFMADGCWDSINGTVNNPDAFGGKEIKIGHDAFVLSPYLTVN